MEKATWELIILLRKIPFQQIHENFLWQEKLAIQYCLHRSTVAWHTLWLVCEGYICFVPYAFTIHICSHLSAEPWIFCC